MGGNVLHSGNRKKASPSIWCKEWLVSDCGLVWSIPLNSTRIREDRVSKATGRCAKCFPMRQNHQEHREPLQFPFSSGIASAAG